MNCYGDCNGAWCDGFMETVVVDSDVMVETYTLHKLM